jgi:hypothetical protein
MKRVIGVLLSIALIFSSYTSFAADELKDSKVIERQIYRQDISVDKMKLFQYNGEYYISLDNFKRINGFNVTCDTYGNMLYVFISRAKIKYFDYYFDYDAMQYEEKVKVDRSTYTSGVALPISLKKEDYPNLSSMFEKVHSTYWFIPISYIVTMTGGTFDVSEDKAVIDYGYTPSVDPREKGRQ